MCAFFWSASYSNGICSTALAGKCCNVFSQRRHAIQCHSSTTNTGNFPESLSSASSSSICNARHSIWFGKWYRIMPDWVSFVIYNWAARRHGLNIGTVKMDGVPCKGSALLRSVQNQQVYQSVSLTHKFPKHNVICFFEVSVRIIQSLQCAYMDCINLYM